MINIIIGGILLILVILAVKSIIKSKGSCHCGNSDCHCCEGHCHDKK